SDEDASPADRGPTARDRVGLGRRTIHGPPRDAQARGGIGAGSSPFARDARLFNRVASPGATGQPCHIGQTGDEGLRFDSRRARGRRGKPTRPGLWTSSPRAGLAFSPSHAITSPTTFPWTSVSRKSRPE